MLTEPTAAEAADLWEIERQRRGPHLVSPWDQLTPMLRNLWLAGVRAGWRLAQQQRFVPQETWIAPPTLHFSEPAPPVEPPPEVVMAPPMLRFSVPALTGQSSRKAAVDG